MFFEIGKRSAVNPGIVTPVSERDGISDFGKVIDLHATPAGLALRRIKSAQFAEMVWSLAILAPVYSLLHILHLLNLFAPGN